MKTRKNIIAGSKHNRRRPDAKDLSLTAGMSGKVGTGRTNGQDGFRCLFEKTSEMSSFFWKPFVID